MRGDGCNEGAPESSPPCQRLRELDEVHRVELSVVTDGFDAHGGRDALDAECTCDFLEPSMNGPLQGRRNPGRYSRAAHPTGCSAPMTQRARPVFLNPLAIKLPIGALTSIGHRISGFVLTAGVPFWVYLWSLSFRDEQGFLRARELMGYAVA
jgi:hypothetical protein